ncbi:MAG: BMP family ABC transporter substrate-binding protein [Oscillospiraceae bacterium]|nr:BMP family ABC transporter substrate-binding protein [Oscillospiraceae bacterium]
MKKTVAFLLIAAMIVCLFAGCKGEAEPVASTVATSASVETSAPTEAPSISPYADYGAWQVALLTEESTVADQSCSRILFDAGKAWCEAHGVGFRHYAAAERTKAELVALIDLAVSDGSDVLILPDWSLTDAIKDTVGKYPDVRFVLFDMYPNEFGRDYALPANVCTAVYREEVLGFMAGFAAVMLGYRHLSFVGTKKAAPVTRYGYGFAQGAAAAALELGTEKEIAVEFAYANTTAADPAVTAFMDDMFRNRGVELCFVCGADIAGAVCEAAKNASSGKVIGTDVDMALILEPIYGEGVTATSAVKNYAATVQTLLSDIIEKNMWRSYSGQTHVGGIVSGKDLDANAVGLAPSTRYADGKFSEEDYAALVAALYAGDYVVSDDTKNPPKVAIAVNYLGNIK